MKRNFKKREHKLNDEIIAIEVRIADDGSIMKLEDALALAVSKEMDLMLVNESAIPPVCKILKYEKFIYDLGKKAKTKSLDVKEIKLGPNTAENDLAYRAKHIIEFLQKGHKVKLSLQFRGREMAHIDLGKALLLKLVVSVEEHGILEAMPNMEGKKMFATLKPKPQK